MNSLRNAAQAALEALELVTDLTNHDDEIYEAITALRAALAQQSEPVQDQRCRAEPRSDGDFVCDCKIGECPGRSAEPAQEQITRLFGTLPVHDTQQALAQQAEPVEPVARECSDPMCACRGGPCAECEEGEREKEIEDLRSSLYFYQRRCEALQSWQSKMRDPERTIVCDILANGKTLDPAVAGNRYTTPQQAEPVEPVEPVAGRAFLERILTAMEGVIDVADRKTDEFDALRSCVIDLTLMLHTAPPQRKPLTEEEIRAVYGDDLKYRDGDYLRFARAVEQASWEKNHG